jgi:hypothetical protein
MELCPPSSTPWKGWTPRNGDGSACWGAAAEPPRSARFRERNGEGKITFRIVYKINSKRHLFLPVATCRLRGLVRDEKGQVVLGIYQKEGDRLEVVLNHTDTARPSVFKADRSRYRLIFRKLSR